MCIIFHNFFLVGFEICFLLMLRKEDATNPQNYTLHRADWVFAKAIVISQKYFFIIHVRRLRALYFNAQRSFKMNQALGNNLFHINHSCCCFFARIIDHFLKLKDENLQVNNFTVCNFRQLDLLYSFTK